MFANPDTYVTEIVIDIPKATFKIFGNDGASQVIECDDADQFCSVHQVAKKAIDIDNDIVPYCNKY